MENLEYLPPKNFPKKSMQFYIRVYINTFNRLSLIQSQKNEAHIRNKTWPGSNYIKVQREK